MSDHIGELLKILQRQKEQENELKKIQAQGKYSVEEAMGSVEENSKKFVNKFIEICEQVILEFKNQLINYIKPIKIFNYELVKLILQNINLFSSVSNNRINILSGLSQQDINKISENLDILIKDYNKQHQEKIKKYFDFCRKNPICSFFGNKNDAFDLQYETNTSSKSTKDVGHNPVNIERRHSI